jgi:3-oxoacyl-[acyl-carrier protein] reductase
MVKRLTGKSALITGVTRGIGRAIAERLIADGAEVSGTGTRPNVSVPEGCLFHVVDFSDVDATARFSEFVGGGGYDILVNNAGINRVSPFADIDQDEFLKIQKINVTAPFLLCRAAIPFMKKNGWGRIINISSVWGKIAKEYRGSYAASKFALDGMTTALAAEVAEFGILANCVAPGFIDTDLTRKTLGEKGISNLVERVPARRLGKPEEIAEFVAWLASPENSYISGQNLAIDGGFTRV